VVRESVCDVKDGKGGHLANMPSTVSPLYFLAYCFTLLLSLPCRWKYSVPRKSSAPMIRLNIDIRGVTNQRKETDAGHNGLVIQNTANCGV
jgi:hypothetical protein